MAIRPHVAALLEELERQRQLIAAKESPGYHLFQDLLDDVQLERHWVAEHRRDPGWTKDFLFEYRHHLIALEATLWELIVRSGSKQRSTPAAQAWTTKQVETIDHVLQATRDLQRFLTHLDSPPDPV